MRIFVTLRNGVAQDKLTDEYRLLPARARAFTKGNARKRQKRGTYCAIPRHQPLVIHQLHLPRDDKIRAIVAD